MRDKIHDAIITYANNGGTVSDPKALLDTICQALGDEADRFEHDGWVVERRLGSAFKGVRGYNRQCIGWIATHKATGTVEEFPPEGNQDMPPALVKRSLETKSKLIALGVK